MFTVSGTGRIVKDAVTVSQNSDNSTIVSFSVADSDQSKDKDGKEKISYQNCKVFGKYAASISKYLTKGKMLFVTGALKEERWKNDEGKSQSRDVIYVDRIEFLSNNNTSSKKETPAKQENVQSEKKAEKKEASSAPAKSDSDNTVSSEDIPY